MVEKAVNSRIVSITTSRVGSASVGAVIASSWIRKMEMTTSWIASTDTMTSNRTTIRSPPKPRIRGNTAWYSCVMLFATHQKLTTLSKRVALHSSSYPKYSSVSMSSNEQGLTIMAWATPRFKNRKSSRLLPNLRGKAA